jgi:hypothetical protein
MRLHICFVPVLFYLTSISCIMTNNMVHITAQYDRLFAYTAAGPEPSRGVISNRYCVTINDIKSSN